MNPVSLHIENLSHHYHPGLDVLQGVNLTVPPGGRCFIIGPNGGGKSTLLKLAAGLMTRQSGGIFIDQRSTRELSPRELARLVTYVPQFRSPTFPYTVLDTVVMGRAPHLSRFNQPGKACYQKAEEALMAVGIAHLSDRLCTELSGGEWQLVNIARALTQESGLLLLDEPTVHLDMAYRERVLGLLTTPQLSRTTLVMVSHFPDIALRFQGQCLLLNKSPVAPCADSRLVLSDENLSRTFGIPVKRVQTATDPVQEICLAHSNPDHTA